MEQLGLSFIREQTDFSLTVVGSGIQTSDHSVTDPTLSTNSTCRPATYSQSNSGMASEHEKLEIP
jgi:hypothetical protein